MKLVTTTSYLTIGILLVSSYFPLHECHTLLRGRDGELPPSPHNEEKINTAGNSRSLGLVAEWPNKGRKKAKTKIKVMNSLCGNKYNWFLDTAISEWSISRPLKFEKFIGQCGNKQHIDGMVNVINEYKSDVGWSGLASYKYELVNNKWRIGSVIVTMNDYYLQNSAMSTSTYYHRRQNMCHELGHSIGIGHPDLSHNNRNIGSCMDYSAYPEGGMQRGVDYGPSNLVPSKQDYRAIKSAYFNKSNRKLANETSTENYNTTEEDILPGPDNIEYQTFHGENIFETFDFNATTDTFDFDNVGVLVHATLNNGITEQRYEKYDDEGSTLFVTLTSGVHESHRR